MERTLKRSLPLRFSAKIMYAFFNSPTFTTFPFHPSTLMMNCTNYDNYHNTICYFLLLLIPFYVSTLHSAPCSQTHSKHKPLFPYKNQIRMSLMCTQNDPFSWNLRRRRKRPNTHGPFWTRWYHWKIFGGPNPWCHLPKAGSTSVPNCRESLKSSKTVNVIIHKKMCTLAVNSVVLKVSYRSVKTLSCKKYDDSSWRYLPCNGVKLLLLRDNVPQSLNLCMFSRQMTVALLPKTAVTHFKWHITQ